MSFKSSFIDLNYTPYCSYEQIIDEINANSLTFKNILGMSIQHQFGLSRPNIFSIYNYICDILMEFVRIADLAHVVSEYLYDPIADVKGTGVMISDYRQGVWYEHELFSLSSAILVYLPDKEIKFYVDGLYVLNYLDDGNNVEVLINMSGDPNIYRFRCSNAMGIDLVQQKNIPLEIILELYLDADVADAF